MKLKIVFICFATHCICSCQEIKVEENPPEQKPLKKVSPQENKIPSKPATEKGSMRRYKEITDTPQPRQNADKNFLIPQNQITEERNYTFLPKRISCYLMNEDDFILINPSDTLDLHHFKPSEVKELLGEFIYSCAKNGIYEVGLSMGKVRVLCVKSFTHT